MTGACFRPVTVWRLGILRHREPFPNSYAWMEAFQPFMQDPAVCAARAIPEERTTPATRHRPQWTEPEYADPAPSYSVYRPATREPSPTHPANPGRRRPESADVRG